MLSNMNYKNQRKLILILFLLVPVALLITFTFIPALNMFSYSFFEWDGFSTNKIWVGFSNYIEIFKNPEIFASLKNSIYYLIGGLIQLAIAFYFAALLNTKVRGKGIFKAILFFPFLINGVAISLIFIFFFQPEGTMDSILALLGLGKYTQLWLGNENIVNISLMFTSIWRYSGLNFIIFLGALQSIPDEVLEASDIDGASQWNKVKYIMIPSVKRVIQLNLILSVSGAISVYEIPYIMTGGANGSSTFVIETVNTAFKFNKVGLASAMAIVVLIIVAISTLIQKKFFKEEA